MGLGANGRQTEAAASKSIDNIPLCEGPKGRTSWQTKMKTFLQMAAVGVMGLAMAGFGANVAAAGGKHASEAGSADHGGRHDGGHDAGHDGKDKAEAFQAGETAGLKGQRDRRGAETPSRATLPAKPGAVVFGLPAL